MKRMLLTGALAIMALGISYGNIGKTANASSSLVLTNSVATVVHTPPAPANIDTTQAADIGVPSALDLVLAMTQPVGHTPPDIGIAKATDIGVSTMNVKVTTMMKFDSALYSESNRAKLDDHMANLTGVGAQNGEHLLRHMYTGARSGEHGRYWAEKLDYHNIVSTT